MVLTVAVAVPVVMLRLKVLPEVMKVAVVHPEVARVGQLQALPEVVEEEDKLFINYILSTEKFRCFFILDICKLNNFAAFIT